jgi:broad specificity phosphatase PhoE
MTLPEHLLSAWTAHRKKGRRAVLMVRHAERHPVVDLRTHESVLLTDRGHEQARAAGEALAHYAREVRVQHSPVMRCAQTAAGIVKGAAAKGVAGLVHGPVSALGNPFVLDEKRAYTFISTVGGRFIRDWFDGRAPEGCFLPRAVAARGQIAAAVAALEHSEVLVTHDWNLALVREEFLAIAPERAWPSFLDGVVVTQVGEEVVIEAEGRTGRVRRDDLG